MICPVCNNDIDYGLSTCPYCCTNLSFSTKVRKFNSKQPNELIETSKSLKKGFFSGFLIAMFFVISIIVFFSISGFKIFKIINISFVRKGLKTSLYFGIAGIIGCSILMLRRKHLKLLQTLITISIALITSSIIVSCFFGL